MMREAGSVYLDGAFYYLWQVTFDAGTPLSSSPLTNSNNQPTSPQTSNDCNKHLHMTSSFSTIDISASPTSFYRPIVDRMLRYGHAKYCQLCKIRVISSANLLFCLLLHVVVI